MFNEMDTISSYSREDAVNDGVLKPVEQEMFLGNEVLQSFLGKNDSIVLTDTFYNSLVEISIDEKHLSENIQHVGRGMISAVLKIRQNQALPQGNTLFFEVVFVLDKATIKRKIKSVTHIEPKLFGLDNAKCITFMMENED